MGKHLTGVATIHTVRNRYRLCKPGGGELYAEIADDSVRAWADERLLAWREVEVELGPRTTTGENGVTFGLLFGREQRIADECRQKVRKLL